MLHFTSYDPLAVTVTPHPNPRGQKREACISHIQREGQNFQFVIITSLIIQLTIGKNEKKPIMRWNKQTELNPPYFNYLFNDLTIRWAK